MQHVYVNSFGELSTDPDAEFDPNTARILAKPEKYGRTLNFAESINFGLNEYLAPSNRNQHMNANEDHLNILRHEIQAELNTKTPVHRSTSSQEAILNFNLLSHGFSNKKKDYSKYSRFQTAKQASIKHFSTYDFSIDTNQTHKHNPIKSENSMALILNKTQLTPETVDSFLINSLFDFPSEPIVTELEDTDVEVVKKLFSKEREAENNFKDDYVIRRNTASSTEKSIERSTATTTTTATPSHPKKTMTTQTIPETKEKKTEASLRTTKKNLTKEPLESYNDESFLTDLKVVENRIDGEKALRNSAKKTTSIVTSSTPHSEISTKMLISVKAVETRVRSRKRHYSPRNRSKEAITATTIRPHIERSQSRPNLPTNTTEHHTFVNERNRNISRQRARTTTTTLTPNKALKVKPRVTESLFSRKRNVRNMEDTLKARANSLSAEKNTKINFRSGRINNQGRRKTTTTTPIPTQAGLRSSRITSKATTYTTSRQPKTTTDDSSPENIIGTNVELIPLNVSLINEIDLITTTTVAPFNSISSSSISSQISTTNTNNTQTLNNDIETLLSFHELTRAIADESILQNYRQQQVPQQVKKIVHHNPPTQVMAVVPLYPTTSTKSTGTKNIFRQASKIVIARAEEQSIDTTTQKPFVPLQKQQEQNQKPKNTNGTSYESLNEFLSKKFGSLTNYYTNSPNNIYSTQQEHQTNQHLIPGQQQTHFPIQRNHHLQPQTKHIVYAQPARQQQFTHNNILKNLQQPQQLKFYHNNLLTTDTQANNYRRSLTQQQQHTGDYRNINLPALNDGIIPVAYFPVAQRRLDSLNFEPETSTLSYRKLFTGVSSYDVPLRSVGRLSGDKTQRTY